MKSTRHSFISIFIAALLPVLPSVWAGARKVYVQGKLTDSGGTPLSGAQTVTFKLYDAATAGTMVWTSGVLSVTPTSGGLFNVPLQDGTPSLDTVSFDKPYYVGITVGGDPEMTPRQEMGASALASGSSGDFQVSNNLTVKNGSLGIGTSYPSEKLDVAGNIRLMGGAKTILFSDPGNYDFSVVHNGGGSLDIRSPEYGVTIASFFNNGNVGIGTSAPLDKLSVVGIGRFDRNISQQPASYLRFFRSGVEKARIGLDSMDQLTFMAGATDNSVLSVSSNAFVGIGTTSPTGTLEVSRNADPSVVFRNAAALAPNNYVRVNMLGGAGAMLDTNFIGAVEGKVVSVSPLKTMLWFRTNVGNNSAQVAAIDELGRMWASSFNVMSDQRLKVEPLPLTDTLSKLKKISAKSYKWKKNMVGFEDKKRKIGFYAQEVEDVFPELVSEVEREDGVFKGVDYGGMVPVLLEAIKDQQKQIETLTARVKTLEKR